MGLASVKDLPRHEDGIRAAISVLKQRFGERLSTGESLREQHSHTTTYLPSQLPDAVVFAQSTQEVSEIIKVCATHKCPVIAFGTGTSLEGGVNAPAGGLSIDVMRMSEIIQVNPEDMDVRVQPGVTREDLNTHLRDLGMFFPIDPGANASLGGMAATRASGTNAVRYGTMRENVISLTVVMADGSIVRTASRAKKSSSGYDLTRLMIGSEGTLGIITELTLKLHAIPESMAAAICSFPTVSDACNTTMAAIQCAIPLARIELMDEVTVEMVNNYSGLDNPLKPLLLLEFHGTESSVAEQAELFREIVADNSGSDFNWVTKAEDRNRLWKARHNTYWAMKAAVGARDILTTDICVPISSLAEAVAGAQADVADHGMLASIVGHVGDGNFHVGIAVDTKDAKEIAAVEDISEKMVKRALAVGGTCTGEHGVGQGKMDYVAMEHGDGVLVMSAIKKALDPDNILNPGKIVEV